MKTPLILATAVALAAGAASAQPVRLTDTEFLRASQCLAIKARVASADVEDWRALVRAQERRRDPAVYAMADQAAQDGRAIATRAGRGGESAQRVFAQASADCAALQSAYAAQVAAKAAAPKG